ncbi:MAG: hypothetical protein Q9190_000444 [Brigantiaea leucoxantha]
MSSTTTTTTGSQQKLETPFTTAALHSDIPFWRSYIAARPNPQESFFHFINAYHSAHGDPSYTVAHDVGTGPGNIASRLAAFYSHVVGSDVNEAALAAAPALTDKDLLKRMTFVKSPAEGISSKEVGIPADVGAGKTDLITVSECMPLLDPNKSLRAFHELLKPGGTVAIYFYGRPIFADGSNAIVCDEMYDRVATRICQFLLPFKGTPGFPFHVRGAEALVSWLDNIAFDPAEWESVERHKWNYDVPLLFNSRQGYDFDFERVDRRGEGEKTIEVRDRQFWSEDWNIERVRSYLGSVYPNWQKKAGKEGEEVVEGMLEELRSAMGQESRKVSFPVVLVLATRKQGA